MELIFVTKGQIIHAYIQLLASPLKTFTANFVSFLNAINFPSAISYKAIDLRL